jgi:hypothetical protein
MCLGKIFKLPGIELQLQRLFGTSTKEILYNVSILTIRSKMYNVYNDDQYKT